MGWMLRVYRWEIFTDSKNLWKAVQTTALVDDPRLRTDLAALKESLENKEITKINRIPGSEMLADCLTKKGIPTCGR